MWLVYSFVYSFLAIPLWQLTGARMACFVVPKNWSHTSVARPGTGSRARRSEIVSRSLL